MVGIPQNRSGDKFMTESELDVEYWIEEATLAEFCDEWLPVIE